jgi:alkylated DNA nucleotide flippase Atl1
MASDFLESIWALARRVPAGRATTYGQLAEAHYGVRRGARRVGQAMARCPGDVPWWRVVHADGSPPVCHDGRAVAAYRAEGTPMRPGGERIDMRRARWDGR